jgi:hypothetical protein
MDERIVNHNALDNGLWLAWFHLDVETDEFNCDLQKIWVRKTGFSGWGFAFHS